MPLDGILIFSRPRSVTLEARGPKGSTGDPGGNILAIGLFAAAGALLIPVGTDLVQTSGYSVKGKGHALYVADAAVDAAWVAAHPQSGFISANARGFRLSHDQDLRVTMFGALGDGVANDQPAFMAAQNYVAFIGTGGYGYNIGVPSITVPWPVGGFYNFGGNPLDVTYPVRWLADGVGGGEGGVVLKWNNTSSCVRVQWNDTVGDAGTQAMANHRGSGTVFEGFHIDGGYVAGDEAERHGFHCRGVLVLRDTSVFNCAGDAVHVDADVAQAQKGNANLVTVEGRCFVQNCRDGWWARGGDTNACSTYNFSVVGCRRWSINEGSFLGNCHFGFHLDGSARTAWNTGLANRPCSYVSHGGNQYFVIEGQAAGASVNAPSGTTADNAWWGYWQAGGVSAATGVPAWFNGINVRSGGPVLCWGLNNTSKFIPADVEINGVSQFDQRSLPLGGDFNAFSAVRVSGGNLYRNRLGNLRSDLTGLVSEGSLTLAGSIVARDPTNFLGPNAGSAVVDATTVLASRSTQHVIQWQIFDSGGNPGAVFASIGGYSGLGLIYDTAGARIHRFRIGNVDMAQVVATGLELPAGKVLTVNGQQVIGARGAAVADPAAITSSDAANAAAAPTKAEFDALVLRFNQLRADFTSVRTAQVALLARLRAATGHGVIA